MPTENVARSRQGKLDALEALVDASSLHQVLDMLAEVASLKGAHLAENWQDTRRAAAWHRCRRAITKAADKADRESC